MWYVSGHDPDEYIQQRERGGKREEEWRRMSCIFPFSFLQQKTIVLIYSPFMIKTILLFIFIFCQLLALAEQCDQVHHVADVEIPYYE